LWRYLCAVVSEFTEPSKNTVAEVFRWQRKGQSAKDLFAEDQSTFL